MREVGKAGRAAGQFAARSKLTQVRRSNTQRRRALAKSAWNPADMPEWLTEETYLGEIQPKLKNFPISAIQSQLGVSRPYASEVRVGRRRPHPRHWQVLAELVGFDSGRVVEKGAVQGACEATDS